MFDEATLSQLKESIATAVTERLGQITQTVVPEPKDKFDEVQAAEYLGISVSALQYYRRQKLIAYAQFPPTRNGNHKAGTSRMFGYRRADLDAFFDKYLRVPLGEGKRQYVKA